MSLKNSHPAERRKKLLAGLAMLCLGGLIAIGAIARRDGFPLAARITTQNAIAKPHPPTAPQLSKEYIYAGTRLLAVEDANAFPIPQADLAVWRPNSGTWWVMGGAGGSQPATQNWGTTGDKPVPGDYDGDGKTDFSVFRPSTGDWYVLQSSNNAWAPLFAWGTSTDVRVPADYDGDGKTDRAVWRPSDGVWYIVRSSDQSTVTLSYGTNGDVPSPADYDGDGRADLAVWRNSNRTFYSIGSAHGSAQGVVINQSSSEPVSGDYDGDGRADYALRNGSLWVIRHSSTGATVTVSWQNATDLSVRNDYDGDGKLDIAVWRNSNGNWYIRQSAFGNALRQVQWGIPGDIPVPAFFRR